MQERRRKDRPHRSVKLTVFDVSSMRLTRLFFSSNRVSTLPAGQESSDTVTCMRMNGNVVVLTRMWLVRGALFQISSVGSPSGKVVEPWGNVRRDLRVAVQRANAQLATEMGKRGGTFERSRTSRLTTCAGLLRLRLAQNDVPLLVIATLLGHSSTRMVEKVYGRLSAKNMDDAIAALPEFKSNKARIELTTGHDPACAIHIPGGECSCQAGRS